MRQIQILVDQRVLFGTPYTKRADAAHLYLRQRWRLALSNPGASISASKSIIRSILSFDQFIVGRRSLNSQHL
jgi:hypothetical protein